MTCGNGIIEQIQDEGALAFWLLWINEYTDEQIRRFDLESCRDGGEVESFGLSALPRIEAARIMRVAETRLQPRKTIDAHGPTAYNLKHRFERFISLEEGRPYYVSELQAAVVMRVLGFKSTSMRPGRYNVTRRSYNALCEDIESMGERYASMCDGSRTAPLWRAC